MTGSFYPLLDQFAAGDPEVLDAFANDMGTFITVLEQACERKSDPDQEQFTLAKNPEKYVYVESIDMKLAEGLEKLAAHMYSQPNPWTKLSALRKEWLRFRNGLHEHDQYSLRKKPPLEIAASLLGDINKKGMEISYELISDCETYLMKKIYDGHPDLFELYEPDQEDVDALVKISLNTWPTYPVPVLKDLARGHAIITEHGNRVVYQKALAEYTDGPDELTL